MKRILVTSAAAIAMSILVLPAASAQARTFSYTQNKTKAGTETFTRTATNVTGDFTFDSTRTRIHYEGRIAADGTMPRLDIRVTDPKAKTQRLISVIVGRDSTRLIEHLGNKTDTIRAATQPGTMPFINITTGLTEVAIARARMLKSGSPTVSVPVVMALDFDTPMTASLPSKVDAGPLAVTFAATDTVKVGTPKEIDRLRIILGSDGHARAMVSGKDSKEHFAGHLTSKP